MDRSLIHAEQKVAQVTKATASSRYFPAVTVLSQYFFVCFLIFCFQIADSRLCDSAGTLNSQATSFGVRLIMAVSAARVSEPAHTMKMI